MESCAALDLLIDGQTTNQFKKRAPTGGLRTLYVRTADIVGGMAKERPITSFSATNYSKPSWEIVR